MNLKDLIGKYADGYKVPSELVFALAEAQTYTTLAGYQAQPETVWLWDLATRQPFRRLIEDEPDSLRAPDDFLNGNTTEWIGQRSGWGPFLMRGTDLRQGGYYAPFALLCNDPVNAALWGCRHLSLLRDKYYDRHGWSGVLAAFKAGRPRMDDDGLYHEHEFIRRVGKHGAARFL